MPMPEANSKEEEEFRAQSDMRTLVEAAEIRADSKRLKAAVKMAGKERKRLNAIKED